MARKGVTFWGTAKSLEGGRFRRAVNKPRPRRTAADEVSSWPAADRTRLLKQLTKLRTAEPGASPAWLAEELNRWVATKPLVRHARSSRGVSGRQSHKRPLKAPTLTGAHIKALLRPPAPKVQPPKVRPLTEKGARALAEGLTAERERRRQKPGKSAGGAPSAPAGKRKPTVMAVPARWPPAYRRRVQKLLRDHLASEPAATPKQLRAAANKFHSRYGKQYGESGGISKAHVSQLLEAHRWSD